MIAREGYVVIGAVVALSLLLILLGWWAGPLWIYLALGFSLLFLVFTLYFFRDPARTPPSEAAGGELLLAPADGKVVVVEEEVEEPLYLKGPAKQVSIFLSPLNVHVNRSPADGVVEYENYVPGKYLVAWHPKASEENERSEIGIRHRNGTKILFKQIAGAVARRIVYHVGRGDELSAGERFGIVRFGSRMDVLVPPHVSLDVEVGDRVQAGLTILGRVTAPQETVGSSESDPTVQSPGT